MFNGVKVSITKIMIASAPAMKGEAGQLLSAEVGEVRFITVVLSFCMPCGCLLALAARSLMRADRLSPGITPADEWYHAIALAKPGLGGGVACERGSVQGPGHGGVSPEKVGQ
jgi:hypothetical protein